jgi:hypothetical protein
VLQEGLLKALVARAAGTLPRVRYLRSVAEGAEYDEYEITWMKLSTRQTAAVR